MEIDVNRLDTQIKLSSELYMFKEAYRCDGMKELIENYEAIKEAVVSNEFKSETGEYKGSKTITISTTGVDGKDKYVLGFGLKKAKAILSQIEEIKAFVEANDNKSEEIDVDKLTDEQKELVQSFVKK